MRAAAPVYLRSNLCSLPRAIFLESKDREDFMEAAIERIMLTYDLLVRRPAAAKCAPE
jgi:hypothetical protein